jgi:hypothetical protein
MTLHCFARCGLAEQGIISLKKFVDTRPNARKNWEGCKILIIDEVSMVLSFLLFIIKLRFLMNFLISWML